MGEALISRFGCRKIDRNEGIPEGSLRNCMEKVATGQGHGYILARVILASRLHYFHFIDSEWTRGNIIKKMSWEHSDEAGYLWQGYLWLARISADLLLDLKEYFLQTVSHLEELHSNKEHFFQLIAIILLQRADAFTRAEQTELLRKIGKEGHREVVRFFARSFQGDEKEKENEIFWNNRLKPLFKQVWPKDAASIDETTSQYLSLLAVKTGKKFPEAIQLLQQILGPFHELYPLIIKLNDSPLPKDYPDQILQLFDMVFTEAYQYPIENFRELLNKIIKSNPSLRGAGTYQRIDRYLQQHNL